MKMLLLSIALLILAPLGYAENTIAPGFTLANADDTQISFPRKHNGVDIYLFWATWCPYCKALMPHLQSMQIEYGDDIRIFAFNIRDEEDPWFYMEEKGYDFTLMLDADPLMKLYGVQGVPALFLVDGAGLIHFNLYDMIFNDSEEYKALSHGKKAGYRAPNWAAEIRITIDKLLSERKSR
ncbi:MAG: redoxin domain-containing protein [Xanthomonadales bacterium]|nr:redoxin domain-containing protein [Xanthomonadales bacterium]